MKSRSARFVVVTAVLLTLVVGVGRTSAGEVGARTADCGRLVVLAAGLSPFRAWAKGVPCSSGRSLLTSGAVARGLPRRSFVPPRLFRAKGFECAYDVFTLICWAGHVSGKRLSIEAYHLAAARSGKVVLAASLGEEVTARTFREAAVKVIRARAAQEGKQTSASASAWKGGCLGSDRLLPGVRTWFCTLFDSKSSGECTDQIWLYRTGLAVRKDPAAGWRWESIFGRTPPTCR